MTGIDITLVVIAAVSALIGLYRGLVKELLSLALWVAAFLLALLFSGNVAQLFFSGMENSAVATALGFAVVFICTVIAGALLQRVTGKLVATTGLSGTDRFLGFVFGGARGLVVVVVALVALRPFLDDYHWWQTSVLIPELLVFERDVLTLIGRATDFVSSLASRH